MNVASAAYYHLLWLLRGIQVFALIGRSGTGKSFRAALIAQKYDIELILDDGLIIHDQKILAGKSAKGEKAYLSAIKTALFTEEHRRREAINALKKQKFKRILILGTSLGMVQRIAKRLELPAPARIIAIEEIATQEEIRLAMQSRKTEGKHVVPVPALEIKRDFAHLVYETVKVFFERRFLHSKKRSVFEKTVVRPEFSRRGKLEITEAALSQMVLHCVSEFNASLRIEKLIVKREAYGYTLSLHMRVPYGTEISSSVSELQKYIIESIEGFSGIRLFRVDLLISKIERRPEA
jgi:uncharacterized alkaline shock family protein YloU/adenylate kinase family enzyme